MMKPRALRHGAHLSIYRYINHLYIYLYYNFKSFILRQHAKIIITTAQTIYVETSMPACPLATWHLCCSQRLFRHKRAHTMPAEVFNQSLLPLHNDTDVLQSKEAVTFTYLQHSSYHRVFHPRDPRTLYYLIFDRYHFRTFELPSLFLDFH